MEIHIQQKHPEHAGNMTAAYMLSQDNVNDSFESSNNKQISQPDLESAVGGVGNMNTKLDIPDGGNKIQSVAVVNTAAV